MINIGSFKSSYQRTNLITQTTATKKAQDDGNQPVRIKDLKETSSKKKKQQRLFINRKFMSPQYQRNFARLLNSYQLKALRNWMGFSDVINHQASLNEAQIFILQAARCNQLLYPQKIRKSLMQFTESMPSLFIDEEEDHATAEILDQLILLENYIETILTILAICRKYEQTNRYLISTEKRLGLTASEQPLDLYELIDRKLFRLSWFNKPINIIEKRDIIKWMIVLRDFSDESVNLILIKGLFDHHFNQLTFILDLTKIEEFQEKSSHYVYQLLYDFVCKIPTHIREMLDQSKLLMSRDILGLLLRTK